MRLFLRQLVRNHPQFSAMVTEPPLGTAINLGNKFKTCPAASKMTKCHQGQMSFEGTRGSEEGQGEKNQRGKRCPWLLTSTSNETEGQH